MLPTCRVCLTSAGVLVNIFKSETNTFPSLEHMLNECVDAKVSREDELPKHLCQICLSDVHAAFRFKLNFKQTHRQLKKSLELNKTVDQENITEDVTKRVPKMKIKRSLGTEIRRNTLTKAKRTKSKQQESESEIASESPSEEPHDKESQESDDLEITDESESAENDSDIVPENVPSAGTSADEEVPKKLKQQKVHICKVCDKVFSKRHKWKDHLRVHTDERPYQCKYCPNRFKYSSNLIRHVKMHLPGYIPKKRKSQKASHKKSQKPSHLKLKIQREYFYSVKK